jgi:hypothetical protein
MSANSSISYKRRFYFFIFYQVYLTILLENTYHFTQIISYNRQWYVVQKTEPRCLFVLERRYEAYSFAFAVAAP